MAYTSSPKSKVWVPVSCHLLSLRTLWFQVGLSLLLCAAYSTAYPSLRNDTVVVTANADKRPVSLEDVLAGKFGQKGFNGNWISDTEFSYYDEDGNFVKFDIVTKEKTSLILKSVLEQWRSPSLTLNKDNTKVLIRYEPRAIFRHSIHAKYLVLTLDNLDVHKVSGDDELQNCIWSTAGNAVAYVKDNNVFYDPLDSIPVTITVDGSEKIYNGVTDWVYEEEVFGTANALWFNPDGSKLVYGYFDDTQVDQAAYFIYNEVEIKEDGEITGQYPETVRLNYPKVGTHNPSVKVKIENLDSPGDSKEILPPANLDEPILASVSFVNDDFVVIMWQNRRQNEAEIRAYSLVDPVVNLEVLTIEEPDGWIDAETLSCFPDTEHEQCFLRGNHDGWIRLARINYVTKERNVITPIGVTVLQFLGWDQFSDEAYVIATGNIDTVKDPAMRHLYVIHGDGEFKCLSCELMSPEEERCSYVSSVRFSKDFSYYALTCGGPGPAYTHIMKNGDPLDVFPWEENEALRETLKEFYKTRIEFLRVPVGPNGEFSGIVKCRLPACYNEESNKKFAMIVDVYGGPNSVRVLDNFAFGFGDYMAQTRNVIYCNLDGRGSGNKGTDMLFTINNALGTVEIDDQVALTKHLRDTFKFVDAGRIGIWGWSYGGYATGMVLTHDPEHVFQGGISVAPVSCWIYYDTIYTERYMGLPTVEDNLEGYKRSNLTAFANELKGHEYLLIHGNADDNVHYQQAMAWAKALQHADVLFDQHSYPDEAHGLSNVQKHLYHTMDEFWERTIKLSAFDSQCDSS